MAGSDDRMTERAGAILRQIDTVMASAGAFIQEGMSDVFRSLRGEQDRPAVPGEPSIRYVQGQQWSLDMDCPKPGCGGTVHGGGTDPTGHAHSFLDQNARCNRCGASYTIGWCNGDWQP